MFELATKVKLRFSYRGEVSVEDLWDLPLTELNAIAKKTNAEIKTLEGEEDFISGVQVSKPLEFAKLRLDILKHIITVKLDERDERAKAKEKVAQKAKILELINRKQDEALQGKSLDELNLMLDSL
jgi:hypothetical protein